MSPIEYGRSFRTKNRRVRWCDGRDRQQIAALRRRFEQYRVAGLTDAPRSGHPRSINDDKVTEVINKTLPTKPANATHWSTTLMAKATGLNAMAISRIWRAFGLKPHRLETFKLSPDPHFVAKVILTAAHVS